MTKLLFGFGSDKILIRIDGTKIYFSNTSFGAKEAQIEGLNLSKQGAMKEHPDLEGDAEWRIKTIERFKKKISGFKIEKQRAEYIIEDLRKFGYVPEQMQKEGFRPTKIK